MWPVTARTVLTHVLVAFLALVVGWGWSFSSPIASAPDDDFHLASIWCPPPVESSGCGWQAAPNGKAKTVTVPRAVAESAACYAHDSATSGSCTDRIGTDLVQTTRFDYGLYPGLYYRIMHVLVTSHITSAVLTMRMVNVLIAVLMLVGVSLVASARLRPIIGVGVLGSVVPLGLFTIASTNPSSWAFSGIAATAVGLLVALDAETWPRRGVAAGIGVLGAVLAAMARTDSAVFLAVILLSVAVLHFQKLLRSPWIWPVLGVVALAGIWASQHGSQSTLNEFGSHSTLNRLQLFEYNALEVASIPIGIFGTWALGWLDTPMPASVHVSALVAAAIVTAVGLTSMSWRKAVAVALPVFAAVALPLYVLNRVGDFVGTQVQPRYVLPAVMITLIVLMLDRSTQRAVQPSTAQAAVVWGLLTLAQGVALWAEIRRYTTGLDVFVMNPDNGVEWWWAAGPHPLATLVITSLAFSALLGLVLGQSRGVRTRGHEVSASMTSGAVAVAVADPTLSSQEVSVAESEQPEGLGKQTVTDLSLPLRATEIFPGGGERSRMLG